MKKLVVASIFIFLSIDSFSFTQIVTMQGMTFNPSSFTINYGDTVKWQWVNGIHTTTSMSIPAGAVAWDQNINSTSTSFTYVPAKGGTYTFKCIPHFAMGMTGTFTVICPVANAIIASGGPLTFCNGSSVTLISTVLNADSYQWKKNGNNINGATGLTYKAKTTGSYTLFASNTCGSGVTSNVLSVTVIALPSAIITPADTVNICQGDSIKLKANSGTSLSYQWYKGSNSIVGATGINYYAKQTGNYKVTVTKTTTGCSKTSKITRVVVTGCRNNSLHTAADKQFLVYPNPSGDQFTFKMAGESSGQHTITIYDEMGRKMECFISMGNDRSFGKNLPGGVYILEITRDGVLTGRERIVKLN